MESQESKIKIGADASKSTSKSSAIQNKKTDQKVDRRNIIIAAIALALVAVPIAIGSLIIVGNSNTTTEETNIASQLDLTGEETGEIENLESNEDEQPEENESDESQTERTQSTTATDANNNSQAERREFRFFNDVVGDNYNVSVVIDDFLSYSFADDRQRLGIKGGSFELVIISEYEAFDGKWEQIQTVDNAEIPGLVTFILEDDGQNSKFGYSNFQDYADNECFPGGPGEIEPPCGPAVIWNANEDNWLRAECTGDLGACNSVMRTLRYEN